MTTTNDYDTFARIIDKALSERTAADLAPLPGRTAPAYVVRMCETLLLAIRETGNEAVTLDDLIRLEATCTGADYHHKFAMRAQRLVSASNA